MIARQNDVTLSHHLKGYISDDALHFPSFFPVSLPPPVVASLRFETPDASFVCFRQCVSDAGGTRASLSARSIVRRCAVSGRAGVSGGRASGRRSRKAGISARPEGGVGTAPRVFLLDLVAGRRRKGHPDHNLTSDHFFFSVCSVLLGEWNGGPLCS